MCTLLACGALSGVGNHATGDDPSSAGGALDEFRGGGGVGGGATGPLGGVGGGMTGPGSGNPGGGGPGSVPGGGGSSNPFDDVNGGGTADVPTGSGNECSGSVCSVESPSDVLVGYFSITVSLYQNPETQGGDCNALYPPKVEEEFCELAENDAPEIEERWFSNALIGSAYAKPRIDTNNPDGVGGVVCHKEMVQPPIDPALVPQISVKADRAFFQNQAIYQKTLVPQCQADGKWLASTERIQVPFSQRGGSENVWEFKITALYPENGSLVEKGMRYLTMRCDWGGTGRLIECKPIDTQPLLQGMPVDSVNGRISE